MFNKNSDSDFFLSWTFWIMVSGMILTIVCIAVLFESIILLLKPILVVVALIVFIGGAIAAFLNSDGIDF